MDIREKIQDNKIKIKILLANTKDTSIQLFCDGLLDTGSQGTLINERILSILKLEPSGNKSQITNSEGKTYSSNKYNCFLQLIGIQKTYTPEVSILKRKDIDLIIGMDIIENLKIVIDHPIIEITQK